MSMKKKSTIIALAVLVATSVSAQTVYDAANIISKDLNGTARFVGMGGAMGALGGDISTIGTNPAGIGIYRSNDAMVSFGFSSIIHLIVIKTVGILTMQVLCSLRSSGM